MSGSHSKVMPGRARRFVRMAGLAAGFSVTVAASGGSAAVPVFSNEVAPILLKHCAQCHRPGGIAFNAPFLSYESVRPWAKEIKEKVLLREMPPWPADPVNSVKFRNDARLEQRDIDTLVAWVDSGAPKGNAATLPSPQFAEGWLHPNGLQPDLIVSMPGEFHAPANGEIPYLRYLVKVPLSVDKWVVACQARPGNPALVHHMAITEVELQPGMKPADLDAFASLARQLGLPARLPVTRSAVTAPSNPAVFDMLAVYTPGSTIEMCEDGVAKLLKGGEDAYINFNIHYQTTGKPETDRSMIGFWFRDGPPKTQLFRVPGGGDTIIANGKELLTDTPGAKAEGTSVVLPPIPPYAGRYELIGITGYTEPVTIYQLHPHAHLRARDFQYVVVFPGGREETVLTVPRYDFRWQLAYELETPLKLPAGSKMIVTAHYDNSRNNRFNPAPGKEVYFRDQNQSWDEMFTPFIEYGIGTQDRTRPAEPGRKLREHEVQVAGAVGCLEQNSSQTWVLTHASGPTLSTTQSTTSVALREAERTPLGDRRYQLLGTSVFTPSDKKGRKVAVKGLLIEDSHESYLNVTSLQTAGEPCAP